jgi:LuxR family transcriptional regulator, maltose regulon positive regulatory protein
LSFRGALATGARARENGGVVAKTSPPDAAGPTEETPEALEAVSWTAWWEDDAAVVFHTRASAYRLYKRRGDAAGAARMAIWLACDELDFNGAAAVASGWLRRAHRLLDELDETPEHGWLAFFNGDLARAGGETARTLERATATAAVGRRLGVPDLEMLGLALQGATLVSSARVPEGMRCLDEASAAALEAEATVPIAGAWTFCFLVTACVAVRDYGRALEWCDRIAEFAHRYGSRYMLAFCRAEYGAVYLWHGRWADAERALEASVEDYLRSRPAMTGAALAGLAELRRRQGRGTEAAGLLDRADSSRAGHLCAARQAFDEGDLLRSVELLERLLRQLPEDRRVERAPALELMIRVKARRQELDDAQAALEALRELERLVATDALHAARELAEGRVAAATGDHERARTHLEDAVDGFERCGAPFEAAEARTDLASTLLALGRSDAAEREAEAAREAMRELRAGVEAPAPAPSGLTPREHDVLRLLAEGLTNRQIAERLVVSQHTVHRHVTNILRKLELPSRAAAAAHAVRSGVADSAGD